MTHHAILNILRQYHQDHNIRAQCISKTWINLRTNTKSYNYCFVDEINNSNLSAVVDFYIHQKEKYPQLYSLIFKHITCNSIKSYIDFLDGSCECFNFTDDEIVFSIQNQNFEHHDNFEKMCFLKYIENQFSNNVFDKINIFFQLNKKSFEIIESHCFCIDLALFLHNHHLFKELKDFHFNPIHEFSDMTEDIKEILNFDIIVNPKDELDNLVLVFLGNEKEKYKQFTQFVIDNFLDFIILKYSQNCSEKEVNQKFLLNYKLNHLLPDKNLSKITNKI